MTTEGEIPVLDHDLAADELAWVNAVRQDAAQRATAQGAINLMYRNF